MIFTSLFVSLKIYSSFPVSASNVCFSTFKYPLASSRLQIAYSLWSSWLNTICSSILVQSAPPLKSSSIVILTSLLASRISFPTRLFELVFAQYVENFCLSRKLIIDHGLYISVLSPNVNPSYQFLTSSSLSDNPNSVKASDISSCVKPKIVAYLLEVVVTTSRLFKSEKILSLLTFVIPVKIARPKNGFVLKVELNKFLVNATILSQYPLTYASCIGVSYSSNRIIGLFP